MLDLNYPPLAENGGLLERLGLRGEERVEDRGGYFGMVSDLK